MKKVIPIVSPTVNYLTYVQAVCGINWEIDDKEPMNGIISDEDRVYVQSCADNLRFGDGSLASLAELFYFLPAYIFRENSEGFIEYFSCLEHCYEVRNTSSLFEQYGDHIKRMQDFNTYFLSNIKSLDQDDELVKIKHLSAIYKACYSKYLHKIWDNDKAIIDRTCDYINEIFSEDDIISKWESATGFDLLSDQYQLIVVPSLQLGPRANSLHYGVNIFPAITEYCPKDYFDYFISHEIGTHILKPHTIDKVQLSEENLRVFYIAFENLAKHINIKILSTKYHYELGEDYYEDSVFDNIYNCLDGAYAKDIGRMYSTAIDYYNRG